MVVEPALSSTSETEFHYIKCNKCLDTWHTWQSVSSPSEPQFHYIKSTNCLDTWHTWQSRHLHWSLILQVMPHWAATARYSSLLDLCRISGLFATIPFLLGSSASSSGVWLAESACAAASLFCVKQHVNCQKICMELLTLKDPCPCIEQLDVISKPKGSQLLHERFDSKFQQDHRAWTSDHWSWATQNIFSTESTNWLAWLIILFLGGKRLTFGIT